MHLLVACKSYLNNMQSSFQQISVSNVPVDASPPVMPIHCVGMLVNIRYYFVIFSLLPLDEFP